MKRIEWLPLDRVAVGMRLAESVLDAGGQLLVPAGAEVAEGLLQGLRRREVRELRVEYEAAEDPAEREAYRAQLVAQLDRMFRLAGEGEETRLLYDAVLAFRMEHRA